MALVETVIPLPVAHRHANFWLEPEALLVHEAKKHRLLLKSIVSAMETKSYIEDTFACQGP